MPTSKLYHYAYPFLPPIALAGGYAVASLWIRLQPQITRVFPPGRQVVRGVPWPVARTFFTGLAVVSAAVLVWTLVFGPLRIAVGEVQLLKSSSILRPALGLVVFALLAGRASEVAHVAIPLLMLWLLPFPAYRDTFARFLVEDHPMRTMRACIDRVRSSTPWHGIYVAGPESAYGHQHFFYFRSLEPRERAMDPSAQTVTRYLSDPGKESPVLIEAAWFRVRDWPDAYASVKTVTFENALLLLPGPYGACAGGGP